VKSGSERPQAVRPRSASVGEAQPNLSVVASEDTVIVIVVECCTMSFRPVRASRSAQIEKAEWSYGWFDSVSFSDSWRSKLWMLGKPLFEQLFTIASIWLVWEDCSCGKDRLWQRQAPQEATGLDRPLKCFARKQRVPQGDPPTASLHPYVAS